MKFIFPNRIQDDELKFILYKNERIKVLQEMQASNGRLFCIDALLTQNGGIARNAGINLTDVNMASLFAAQDGYSRASTHQKFDIVTFSSVFFILAYILA